MSTLTISRRIILIVAMSCVGMLVLAGMQLLSLKQSLMEDRRDKTREHVEAAANVVEYFAEWRIPAH